MNEFLVLYWPLIFLMIAGIFSSAVANRMFWLGIVLAVLFLLFPIPTAMFIDWSYFSLVESLNNSLGLSTNIK